MVLPFVGHEDRNRIGDGVGLVSGVARHIGNATVIDCDHRLVLHYLDVEQPVECPVRQHGDAPMEPRDRALGGDPLRQFSQSRAVAAVKPTLPSP